MRLLDVGTFIVREQVALVRLTDVYDILDAGTGQQIGQAEETPPALFKWLRLVVSKLLLPTQVTMRGSGEEGDRPLFTLDKQWGLFRHTVEVRDGYDRLQGRLVSKVFSLGGGFFVFDPQGRQVGEVKGDWIGWNFSIVDDGGNALGKVSKKWNGLGKELLTSADNYVVEIAPGGGQERKILLLAAALAIDAVFKEKK